MLSLDPRVLWMVGRQHLALSVLKGMVMAPGLDSLPAIMPMTRCSVERACSRSPRRSHTSQAASALSGTDGKKALLPTYIIKL